MGLPRFILSSVLAAIAAFGAAGVSAQGVLDRIQGLYYPPGQGTWDCATLGMDGGAVGIVGTTLHGVENSCELVNPRPIEGRDGMAYDTSCSGEGMTYDGGLVVLMPTPNGLDIIRNGVQFSWRRCP